MSDIPLNILLSAVGGSSVISAVSSIASSLGKGGLGGALLATGMAATSLAVGLGVTAVKAAGDFQSQITSLSTGAGESTKNLSMVSSGILKLATDTGTSTKQLTDGMYMIESGGYHGAAGLDILKAAAQGAKVGNADLGIVADATDTVLKNFGDTGLTASNAVNTLVATVSRGKTHMSDLSTSLSQVLPTASAARIGLNDVMGAMSTMTGEGIPAANAATYLRQMLIALQAPSAGSVKALKDIGLTTGDVADAMHKSLPGALQMITDRLKNVYGEGTPEYLAAVKNISGGSKTMQGMLDLTGTHLATFKDNVVGIAGAVKNGGNSIVGWSQVQGNFNQKVSQAKEVVDTLMIKIGQALLPTVTQLVTALLPLLTNFSTWITTSGVLENGLSTLVSGITGLISGITTAVSIGASIISFFQHSQVATDALGVAIAALGAVMALFVVSSAANIILSLLDYGLSILTAVAETVTGAATMTTTFGAMSSMIVTSMGTAAMSILAVVGPLLLIGAIVALVVIGIVLAVQHWGEICSWLQSTWSSALSWLNGALKNAERVIKVVADGFNSALKSVEGPIQSVINWFNAWKTPILSVAWVITIFFLPAMIKAGVEAGASSAKIGTSFVTSVIKTGVESVINGAKITASFVASMAKAGAEAVVNAPKIIATFVASVVKSGVEAVVSGVKVTVSFVGSMIKSGVEAVVSGAKITASFVASLVKTGIEGWASAGKLAIFTGSLIASGVQAVIGAAKITASFIASMAQAGIKAVVAGAQIVASFVASLITTAAQAVMTGATMVASLIPAIVSVVAEAAIAAATAIPALVTGFIAWAVGAGAAAVATVAATWPILLIIAAIALLVVGIVLLVTHWSQVTAFLRGAWQAFVAWITPAIHAVGNVFVSVFNGIRSFLQSAWAFIVANAKTGALLLLIAITGPTGLLVALIITHWSQIQAFISSALSVLQAGIASFAGGVTSTWNGLMAGMSNIVTNLWSNIQSIFNSGRSIVSGIVSSLGSNIMSTLNSLPGMALSAGAAIVNGIASGIQGAIGNATSAISNVMSAIGNFLPHSPAKEGELSHLNEYGPSLVGGFSNGILSALPIMRSTMDLLTKPVGAALAAIADPSTVADQLSFVQAPTSISRSIKAPVATKAVKKETAQDKKEAAAKAAAAKKEAAQDKKEEAKQDAAEKKAKAHEKKVINLDIKDIKHELHIHTTNAHLTHAQMIEIIDEARKDFNSKIADEIRAQFGNI